MNLSEIENVFECMGRYYLKYDDGCVLDLDTFEQVYVHNPAGCTPQMIEYRWFHNGVVMDRWGVTEEVFDADDTVLFGALPVGTRFYHHEVGLCVKTFGNSYAGNNGTQGVFQPESEVKAYEYHEPHFGEIGPGTPFWYNGDEWIVFPDDVAKDLRTGVRECFDPMTVVRVGYFRKADNGNVA